MFHIYTMYPPGLKCPVFGWSSVAVVQVCAVQAPVRREVLRGVILQVFLHGCQAATKLQTQGALVGCGAAVSAQVLDHGRIVTRTLAAQPTLKRFFTWKRDEERMLS